MIIYIVLLCVICFILYASSTTHYLPAKIELTDDLDDNSTLRCSACYTTMSMSDACEDTTIIKTIDFPCIHFKSFNKKFHKFYEQAEPFYKTLFYYALMHHLKKSRNAATHCPRAISQLPH